MGKVIVLEQLGNSQTYVLSGSTHLGRMDKVNNGSESEIHWVFLKRNKPNEFSQLEVCIQINDDYVSRNHAAILSDKLENEFYLMDLNSINGTYLNRMKLEKEETRKLHLGDHIQLAPNIEFKVAKISESKIHNTALLVCNRKNVKDNLEKFAHELSKNGFSNITKLYSPNKTDIVKNLEQKAYTMPSDAHFMFFYIGKSDYNGLSLGNDTLTPYELDDKLNNIRGKKAVFVDCPNSKLFIKNKLLIPYNTLMLTSINLSSEIEKLSDVIINYLQIEETNSNLNRLKNELKKELNESNIYYKRPYLGKENKSVYSSYISLILNSADDITQQNKIIKTNDGFISQ